MDRDALDPPPCDTRRGWDADRIAWVVFVAAVLVAIPTLLEAGRDQWFALDEWDFLAARDLDQPGDLLRPHNEHWTTLPIVVYRLIYQGVGATRYWPYLIPVITAHLSAAALLRVVMRRADVDPWIASAAAIAFVFLGSGREDILWGFQIAFTGSLALGLAQVVLADGRGRVGWRDGLGVACGLGALACSGIGVTMVGAVGLACLLRRDLVRAAVHLGIPAMALIAWYILYGADAETSPRAHLGEIASFVRWTGVDALEGLGGHVVSAVLLGAAAGVGLVVSAQAVHHGSTGHSGRPWRGSADVVALVAAAAATGVVTGWGRAAIFVVERGTVPGRYVHLAIALVLPAIAVGLSTTASRVPRPPLGTVLATVLLLVGLPGNVGRLEPTGSDIFGLGNEARIQALAETAVRLGTPPDLEIDPVFSQGLSAGWLQRATAAGELRRPSEPLDDSLLADAVVTLSFDRDDALGTGRSCAPLARGTPLVPGDVLTVPGSAMTVVSPTGFGLGSNTFTVRGPSDESQVVLRAIREVRVRSAHGPPGTVVQLCRAG